MSKPDFFSPSAPASAPSSPAPASAPAAPEKKGYAFGGWLKDGEPFDFASPVNESIRLTANWNIVTYTITYNLDDGITNPENNPASYTIESDITLEDAVKEGETFVKWVDASCNAVKVLKGLTGNLELTPVFEPQQTGTDDNEGQNPQTGTDGNDGQNPQTGTDSNEGQNSQTGTDGNEGQNPSDPQEPENTQAE